MVVPCRLLRKATRDNAIGLWNVATQKRILSVCFSQDSSTLMLMTDVTQILSQIEQGIPVPKVIDFGVSKAISQQLTEKTLFTAHG